MSRVGQPQREPRDVDPRAVVLSGAALAALVAFTLLFVGLIFGIPPKPLPFGSAMQQLLRQAHLQGRKGSRAA